MTASEPTPETIEGTESPSQRVEHAVDTIARALMLRMQGIEDGGDPGDWRDLARALLTSTDPAVQRALATHQWHACPDVVLDTGTEAGVLREASIYAANGTWTCLSTELREVEQP